jgi:hypothetical protein
VSTLRKPVLPPSPSAIADSQVATDYVSDAEDKVRARKTEPQVLVLVGLNVGTNLDICDFCTAR